MKKIFPIIVLLMIVSLVGLISFQYSFLANIYKTRSDDYYQNFTYAVTDAAAELEREKNDHPIIVTNMYGFLPTLSERLSEAELRRILKKNFDRHNLKNKQFEFALGYIINRGNGDELNPKIQTLYYEKTKLDSNNYLLAEFPIVSLSGTNAENFDKPEGISVTMPKYNEYAFKEMFPILIATALFTIMIMGTFYITVRTMLRQKKLSEIKNDFINNMTHELKTPLATISLAIDALHNEKVQSDKAKYDYFTRVIKDENKRMNKQVESILQSAQLERQEIQLNLKNHSAHELIKVAIKNIELPIAEKNGTLHTKLDAKKDTVRVDEVHFTNLVNNLLDNAVKYSNENNIYIKISTEAVGKMFKIKIEDNGIGMSKDTLGRIFEKFYRAHTGNLHNVKGFGLGLSYVKAIVEAHGGDVKAESTLGKGSTFTVSIPLV